MTRLAYGIAIMLALAMVANIPNMTLAQTNEPVQGQAGPTERQAPQPEGGVATVIGVDQPDNCLRIRSGPGNQYDVIGCANMGDQLKITGVWTSNDWAQLADNGWVYGPQISTDLQPPRTAYSRPPTYVVGEVVPNYDDWAYLPDYGYDTYWYGGVPIFFYNVAVWNWCHPWWWWHGLQAWWWKDGHRGRRAWDHHSFKNFAMARGVNLAAAERSNISTLNRMGRNTRSASIASSSVSKFNANRSNITSPNPSRFNANRSNIRSSNVSRFNANRSNIRSSNVSRFNANRFNSNRSNITSPNVNRFNTNRFRTGTNAFRSRTFSNPSSIRSGSANAFGSRSFSMPRSFRSGSIGGGSFRSMGGGGHFGGGHFGGGGEGRRR